MPNLKSTKCEIIISTCSGRKKKRRDVYYISPEVKIGQMNLMDQKLKNNVNKQKNMNKYIKYSTQYYKLDMRKKYAAATVLN